MSKKISDSDFWFVMFLVVFIGAASGFDFSVNQTPVPHSISEAINWIEASGVMKTVFIIILIVTFPYLYIRNVFRV